MQDLRELKERVCRANIALAGHGLAPLTWGNVSGIAANREFMVIKPSGVPYDKMRPEDMAVVALDSGQAKGVLRPSSDTPTHLALYRAFPSVGGVAHTHSRHAVMFAQACRPIPCLGTTHADNFYGQVPVTKDLLPGEIESDYESNTGAVIVELFKGADMNPAHVPAALVAHHGPFTWGRDCDEAVVNSVVLEETAAMALGTLRLNPKAGEIARELLDKHFNRKHGKSAYYGQR